MGNEKTGAGCTIALRLTRNGVKCFGPGIYRLLLLVESEHSLRRAAMDMGMAYSKAWRIVSESETALGFALLDKKIGGVNGGGAELTRKAVKLMRAYERFTDELSCSATEAVERNFKNIL